jgi:hypothetical protein
MADRSLYGVVLAAGLSTRAGRFKMELPLGDRTLIEHTVLGMREVVRRVVVVGGHRIERLREILRGYDRVDDEWRDDGTRMDRRVQLDMDSYFTDRRSRCPTWLVDLREEVTKSTVENLSKEQA